VRERSSASASAHLPHVHACAWQPIEPPAPPTERDILRELLIERGLDAPRPLWMRD